MQTWAEKIEAKAEARGYRLGRQEGEAALLLRLLTRKFGPLSSASRQKIDDASPDQLLEWGERLVTAQSLEDILGT